MEKETAGGMVPVSIFDKEDTMHLFDILCHEREKLSKKYDMLYFKCFAKNFKLINCLNGSVEIKKGKPRILKMDSLIGMDAVWENVCLAENDVCRTKFNELLIDLYTNLADSIADKRKEILAVFINRGMSEIVKADTEKQELLITNVAKLLLTFSA
jgi:hypothetical protein